MNIINTDNTINTTLITSIVYLPVREDSFLQSVIIISVIPTHRRFKLSNELDLTVNTWKISKIDKDYNNVNNSNNNNIQNAYIGKPVLSKNQ